MLSVQEVKVILDGIGLLVLNWTLAIVAIVIGVCVLVQTIFQLKRYMHIKKREQEYDKRRVSSD